MKLETKLGLCTGFLIGSMLVIAYTAHIRFVQANRISNQILTNRMPVILESRDLRSHLTRTLRALESYMLFGTDPVSSARYRDARKEHFVQAEASLARLEESASRFNSGSDAGLILSLRRDIAVLKSSEERVEQLNETQLLGRHRAGLRSPPEPDPAA